MITYAIIGHLVGDYLLQSDWMAQNKKLRSWPCFVHCAIWTLCVSLWSNFELGLVATLFLFTCHFIQDRTHIVKNWMCLMSPGFTMPPLAPWSLIVVDNVWHIVQIWFAFEFLK